jgi:hypothetical protein
MVHLSIMDYVRGDGIGGRPRYGRRASGHLQLNIHDTEKDFH